MSESTSSPRSLERWLALLEAQQPPIDAPVRDQALEELAGGQGSAASLARTLAVDPAQVLLLFREANRALARYEREAHTLEHAISLLGTDRVQRLLTAAPTLAPDHPHADHYRQALLRSRHAAWQARLWAEGSGHWPADEVFWATLLMAAPLWPLWLEAGETLLQFEQLRARQGAVAPAQQRQRLGCLPRELAVALGERWRLPEIGRLGWRPEFAGTARQWLALAAAARLEEPPLLAPGPLTELCHRPALVVTVANALAVEADWDWLSPRCLRLLGIAATACGRPLATLLSHSHQTAAALSRDTGPGLPTPGARLLGYWQQQRLWPAPEPAARPAPAPLAAPPADADALTGDALVAAALRRLRGAVELDSPRAALELTMAALHRGLGLERVAVLLYRAGSKELYTAYSAGALQGPALRQFRGALKDAPLFARLLQQRVCLQLGDDNRAKFWPLLPAPFRAAASEQGFLLMSVGTETRPLALIYADNQPSASPPTPRQVPLFKQLCLGLSQCLALLGQRHSPAD